MKTNQIRTTLLNVLTGNGTEKEKEILIFQKQEVFLYQKKYMKNLLEKMKVIIY